MYKKCLVLDLDNTLWGGIAGEQGISGIQLGMETPGSGFLAFQQVILDIYHRGVILAINSKNNYVEAMDIIRAHPYMVLKEHHFAAMRINWEDKVQNMRELADELNIGLDSLVFLDDDPVNRFLVRSELPEVTVPELPDHSDQYAKFLLDLPYFQSVATITDEDKMRSNMYVTERLRRKAEKNFTSRAQYLQDLDIEVHCYIDNDYCLERLAQLTERTNQFNINKKPIDANTIATYVATPDYAVFCVSARDKFGDYGVVGFALVKKKDINWNIEALLMSCRALGRGIEEAFLAAISERARAAKKKLVVTFQETDKNKPAQDFINKYFNNYEYDFKRGNILPTWIKLVWKS